MKNITYRKAKQLLKPCGFETPKQYFEEADELGLPTNPEEVFADDWQGWDDYLTSLASYAKPRLQSPADKAMSAFLRRPLIN